VPEDEPEIRAEGHTPRQTDSPDLTFLKRVALSSEKYLIEKRKKEMVYEPMNYIPNSVSKVETARNALEEDGDHYEDGDDGMRFILQ